LLDVQTETIVDAIRQERVRDAVQDVRARSNALNALTSATELDAVVAHQLALTSLVPLEVSLQKARYVLEDYGSEEGWKYCNIVGTSALVAGYSFLGQTMQHLREQLDDDVKAIQESMLDDIAARSVAQGKTIPWRSIPELLKLEHTQLLLDAYEDSVQGEPQLPDGVDPDHLTIGELEIELREVFDLDSLDALYSAECEGKSRIGALKAIDRRREQLSS
jgi:hypothetical protein